MLPWGHLGFGYLLYSAWQRGTGNRPGDAPTIALAVGTQFPDLIDKPLSWHFAVLPTGRTLGHSILTASVIVVGILLFLRHTRWLPAAMAFAVGHVSHILGDALWPIATGDFGVFATFVWPLVIPNAVEYDQGIFSYLLSIELTWSVVIGLGLTIAASVRWWRDGRPGLLSLRIVVRQLSVDRQSD